MVVYDAMVIPRPVNCNNSNVPFNSNIVRLIRSYASVIVTPSKQTQSESRIAESNPGYSGITTTDNEQIINTDKVTMP